jgi:hypothetical protein
MQHGGQASFNFQQLAADVRVKVSTAMHSEQMKTAVGVAGGILLARFAFALLGFFSSILLPVGIIGAAGYALWHFSGRPQSWEAVKELVRQAFPPADPNGAGDAYRDDDQDY